MEYLEVPIEKKDTRVSETEDELVLRQTFGTIRSSIALVQSSLGQSRKVPSQIRAIVLAVLAALFCAIASTARGVASDTPYASQFLLSFIFLLISVTILVAEKRKLGSEFRMPWWVETLDNGGTVGSNFVFDRKIFFLTSTSGLASFITGLSVTLAYLEAVSANSNQGIPSAIVACYIIPCSIVCWVFFGEKLSLM